MKYRVTGVTEEANDRREHKRTKMSPSATNAVFLGQLMPNGLHSCHPRVSRSYLAPAIRGLIYPIRCFKNVPQGFIHRIRGFIHRRLWHPHHKVEVSNFF